MPSGIKYIEKLSDHKWCPDCGEERPFSEFGNDKNGKYGLDLYCKKHGKIRRKESAERIGKRYVYNFKQKHGVTPSTYYEKKRMELDPVEYLKVRTSTLIRKSFRDGRFSKSSKSAKILGCDYEKFLNHLTNNGEIEYDPKQYHLDHIIPVSLARTEEECIALNHYKNFRLLPACDNMSKGSKLPSILELNPGIPDLAFQVYMRAV